MYAVIVETKSIGESRCWSWDHGSDAPLVPSGMHTCPAHEHEEAPIRLVCAELSEVDRAIRKAEELRVQGGDIYKSIVEGAVREFLGSCLPPNFRIGTGFYPHKQGRRSWHEFDIVIDLKNADGWYGGARLLNEGLPPIAHLEVAFRSGRSGGKAGTDLTRLMSTIGRATSAGVKTWTGSVLCGPGWPSLRVLGKRLVDASSPLTCREPVAQGGTWWPAVDIVASPAGALTKTSAFAPDELLLWMLFPGSPHDKYSQLRPLAFAREKLVNFCQLQCAGVVRDRALHRLPRSAVSGPCVGEEVLPHVKDRRIVAISLDTGVVRCEWPSLRREILERAPKPIEPWEWVLPSAAKAR